MEPEMPTRRRLGTKLEREAGEARVVIPKRRQLNKSYRVYFCSQLDN
jgi:hypothetical protein